MSNNNVNSRNLSPDQRLLVNNYITQYNQANNQINHLYTVLGELRYNIATIYNQTAQHLPSSIDRRFNSIYEPYDLTTVETPNVSANILTPNEIEQTTTTRSFSSISMPINDECPIRLELFDEDDIVIQINHCGHIFNCVELNNWFRTNVRCPVCRHNIRESINSSAAATRTTSNAIPITQIENANTNTNANNEIGTNASNAIVDLINSIFDSGPIVNSIIYDLSNNPLFTSNNHATQRYCNRN
jgi:hypothetical protein